MAPRGHGARASEAPLGPVASLLLLCAVAACRLAAAHAVPTYDDAFITYRYAANLAAGHGLVFNPGAPWEPVLGTSTLLYSLVLAGFGALGFDLVVASLALNVACDVASAALLLSLLRARPVAAAAAVLAFAGLPQLARISAGGMESPLFLLTALGACVALQRKRAALGGLCAAANCLVRPEGVLLAAILTFAVAKKPRELVRFLAPIALVGVGAWLALSAVYGSPVPQSVRAKSAMHGDDPEAERARRFWIVLRQSWLPVLAYAPLLPLVLWGLVRALARAGAVRQITLFALAISASYLLARPHTWGWYYYVPLTAWVVWLALGVDALAARVGPRVPFAARGWLPRAAALGAVLVSAGALVVSLRQRSPIEARVYAPLWEWAARTSAAEPAARILASDIGALGHAWSGTVLDSEGLTWPRAVELRQPAEIVRAEKPEYLMVVAERPRLRHMQQRADAFADYEAIARFNATGQTRLDLAPEDVPLDWSQDYLIYKRRAQ